MAVVVDIDIHNPVVHILVGDNLVVLEEDSPVVVLVGGRDSLQGLVVHRLEE